MYENEMDADMDPRLQTALEQMMAGPAFSQVWLMMIPHVVQVVKGDNPADLVKNIEQVATALAEHYMELAAKEREEAERKAAESAPSPFKFSGFDM